MPDTTISAHATTMGTTVRKVFLSYGREDATLVKSLEGALTRLGCTVWLDRNLSGGQHWWDKILEEIRACDLFVLGVTPHSVNSTACMLECEYARNVGKPLLPVLLFDVSTNLLPQSVAEIQLVDYRRDDKDAALSLARAINQMEAAPDLPDVLPSPPSVPTSYLEHLARLVRQDSLSNEEQSRLVVDLKASMLDPKFAADARTLLEQMRSRPDLLARVAREVDLALAADDRLSMPPGDSARTSADDEPARGPSSTKRRLLEIVQVIVGGGIFAAIGISMLYAMLFSPQISVQATDVDWAPRNPQVGQRVTITGKYAVSYQVRNGLRWSRDEVPGKKLNDVFTATWSVDGRETKLEDPRTVTAGDVVDATFEITFERPGPHEIALSVRSGKSEGGARKVVRTLYVQTAHP